MRSPSITTRGTIFHSSQLCIWQAAQAGLANTVHGCCILCKSCAFAPAVPCNTTSEQCVLHGLMHLQAASQQDAVSQKLHMLETHQRETHDSLVQMERTAISMYQVTQCIMHVLLVLIWCAKLKCPVCPAMPRAVIKCLQLETRQWVVHSEQAPVATCAVHVLGSGCLDCCLKWQQPATAIL